MPVWLILTVIAIYTLGLFLIAARGDHAATKPGFQQHPMIYALGLAVYCTSWSFFGGVGMAATGGWHYLPIYLGPIIVFLFYPDFIRRVGDVVQNESITSLSDFLAARYGKSRAIAAAATIAAVIGVVPYIALQLKSVGMSFHALANHGGAPSSEAANETVLFTACILAAFSVVFGARNSDTTVQNAGLMRLLAAEGLIKLAALVAIFILALVILSRPDIAPPREALALFDPGAFSTQFITVTILSMAAVFCLPRQFHVAMIERRTHADLRLARWVFPAYLVVIAIVIVPITLAGAAILPSNVPADLFVLFLPLHEGSSLLALTAFIGGFSAATSMIIISTVALSTMVTNDIVMPTILQSGRLSSLAGDAGARLIFVRRAVIFAILALSYLYYRIAGGNEALAQIGLLSFAAAAQFAPALIAAVYWRGGKASGALGGLITGMLVWSYTLFAPALIGPDRMASIVPGWLDPYALFGLDLGDRLTHGAIWSLTLNVGMFIILSATAQERLRDRVQASVFATGRAEPDPTPGDATPHLTGATPNDLKTLAARFLTPEAVEHAFADIETRYGVPASGDEPADWRLVQRTERLLASALGSSSARVVLAAAIGGIDVALPDLLSILDHKTQAERFDRHMLQSMLEHIGQGISVVDHKQRLVAWNSAYVDMFDYPPDLIAVGQPVADLIAYNQSKGWIEGDPLELAMRRIAHMKAGRPHAYERRNPDGRFLRIQGTPMPGGGYVTTFTDITHDKIREQQLIEANETLEARVQERTQELESMAHDLDAARRDAESANASKTRFLAAASHDLLQPLNAARLFLGSMQAGDMPSDKREQLIAKTDKAIQSADELLKGLLDISRLDHGNIAAKPVELPLGPLLEDLVDEAAPMTDKAGLELKLAPTRLSVRADPDFLKSILRNFLSNARRYTREGGVLVGVRRRGDMARIEVWDTGPGISDQQQPLIFEEFRRFADVDNMGIRGAGLGLSVARRLAGLMGAEIDLRSWPGHGSVFSLSVPIAGALEPRGAHHKPVQSSPQCALEGLTVLCVDDEATIREGMAALLGSWGCTPVIAANADDARSTVKAYRIDAMIVDMQLGDDVSGLDIIADHRVKISHADNVVLLTARNSADVKLKASEAGVPLLAKPANPDEIRRFLANCSARLEDKAAE